MPLLIITGLPCSGKTHRATQIRENFVARISNSSLAKPNSSSATSIVLLPSYHASADSQSSSPGNSTTESLRDSIYSSAALEKTARASEFSAAKRALSKEVVVIADSLNYIKGYRYQLWCEAKAAGTRCAVIHVAAGEGDVRAWNEARFRKRDGEGQQAEKNAVPAGNDGGWMAPESHTTIYGDKAVLRQRRASASSSTDGQVDGEQPVSRRGDIRDDGDAMTLKSLYIDDARRPAPSLAPSTVLQATSDVPSSNLDSIRNSGSTATASPPDPTPPPFTPYIPPYAPTTLNSLIARYEPPSPFSRWDTPLFTIPSTDTNPPYDAIWAALHPAPPRAPSKKILSQRSSSSSTSTIVAASTARPVSEVKQNAATVLPPPTAADALQLIEAATQAVAVALLAQSHRQHVVLGEGAELRFEVPNPQAAPPPPPTTAGRADHPPTVIAVSVAVPPDIALTQPLLQRLRRKYMQVQRGGIAHGQGYVRGGREGVVHGFVRFLEAEWWGGDDAGG